MSDEKWREELKLTVERKRGRARRGSSHPFTGWLAGWLVGWGHATNGQVKVTMKTSYQGREEQAQLHAWFRAWRTWTRTRRLMTQSLNGPEAKTLGGVENTVHSMTRWVRK
jgi:hypothetical protein